MSILALTSDTLIGTAAAGNIEYNGQFFGTDSNASRAQMQRIVQETVVASTSGTFIDFTGIPAWVKRITVMFNGVSTNGTSLPQIQIGAGSFTTSGYLGSASSILSAVGSANYSSGALLINQAVATQIHYGAVRITNISGNSWVFEGILGRSDTQATAITGGVLALSGTLDRVRITTVNGTDAFDAGSINILYEG